MWFTLRFVDCWHVDICGAVMSMEHLSFQKNVRQSNINLISKIIGTQNVES